jgi:hypothetical protein
MFLFIQIPLLNFRANSITLQDKELTVIMEVCRLLWQFVEACLSVLDDGAVLWWAGISVFRRD